MKSMLRFNKFYFVWTMAIFSVEVLIARYAHDQIIRPYIGDVLVVILIYCFAKSFLDTPVVKTAILVLLFSYVVETLQYFHIVKKLGLQGSYIVRTIIGTSFGWIDIIAYTCGMAIVLFVENNLSKKETIVKAA